LAGVEASEKPAPEGGNLFADLLKGVLYGISFFFMTLLVALIVTHPLITCLVILIAVVVIRLSK
jgi:hypothetical protein